MCDRAQRECSVLRTACCGVRLPGLHYHSVVTRWVVNFEPSFLVSNMDNNNTSYKTDKLKCLGIKRSYTNESPTRWSNKQDLHMTTLHMTYKER